MMLKTVIIDDEEHGIRALEAMLSRHASELTIVGTSNDALKGIEIIESLKPDVVFLDISMPMLDGFQLLEQLSYRDFQLVFTTAHREHAVQAIKVKAVDYLLKPVTISELKLCVSTLCINAANRQKRGKGLIELSVRDGIIFVKPQDIIRVEASGSYTVFYLDNQVKHLVSRNLKEWEPLLDSNIFYRCHASHIINLTKVEKMVSAEGLFAKMTDGSTAEISRKNKETFLEKLKKL